MDRVLAHWFTAADALLRDATQAPDGRVLPRWREQLYGGDGGNALRGGRATPERLYVDLHQRIGPDDQRELREAFELFALARRVDCAAFQRALTNEHAWLPLAWTCEPFARDEKLRVRLPLHSRTYDTLFFGPFLEARSDATRSARFREAKRKLLAMDTTRSVDPDEMMRFDLQVQLEIMDGVMRPSEMLEVLRKIDRKVFHVTKIYVILSPDIETAELVDMIDVYRTIHTFRDTAEVETHFDLPPSYSDRTKLIRWKWFFDLVARKSFASEGDDEQESKHQWIIAAMFGVPGLDRGSMAKAATSAAFFSALAHAGDHVTTTTVCMALQDPGSDRRLRAKYLGYLMRAGGLRRLSVRDMELTKDDVALILDMYNKPTRKECLQALYEPAWHARKGSVLDDKNAKKYMPNGNEVLGVMHDGSGQKDDLGDVFLAGFGQCSVKRALLPQVDAMAEAIAMLPTQDRGLKSLDLLFLNGKQTIPGIIRIATTVGRPLEELKLEIEQGDFELMSLFMVLESCRKLRRLSIKQIAITPRDDKMPFTKPATREPLEMLSVEIAPNHDDDDASGLQGLCTVIGNYSSGLKELHLLARNRWEPCREMVPPFVELFTQRLPEITTLRIAGLNSMYLQSLWDRKRTSLRKLEVLILECVPWDKQHWTTFMATLSDPSHPLTQSLRTLHLRLNGFEKMTELQAMLKKNPYLSNIAVDFPYGLRTSSKLIQALQETNDRRVSVLSIRQRAALLSVFPKPRAAIETQLVQSIFAFAGGVEARYVRVSLMSTREDER